MTRLLVLCCFSLLLAGVSGADVTVTVMKGDNVTLLINPEEIKRADDLLWKFNDKNIATIDLEVKNSLPNYTYIERFSSRLNLERNTGYLTINNFTTEDTGEYKLEIRSSEKPKYKTFSVTVSDEPSTLSVIKGDPVTLPTGVKIRPDDVQWKFKGNFIANLTHSTITNMDVNHQTGELKISDIGHDQSGEYEVKINARGFILPKRFSVNVSEEESVSRKEEGSVILHTNTKIQSDDVIEWKFKNTSIALFNRTASKYSYPDSKRKDRVQMDGLGSLTIQQLKTEDSGPYDVNINNSNHFIHKRFSLTVTGGGLSADYITFICLLVIVTVAGVFAALWYRRRSLQLKVQEKFVEEGEPVTLSTAAIKRFIFSDAVIEWNYGGKEIIAEINTKDNTISTSDGDDERFKDRLKLNNETGDLTINNLKTKHSGLYKLKITSSKGWPFSILGASYCQFNVIVKERIKWVKDEDSVILHTDVKELKTSDEILWMYGAEDTHIAKFTVGTERPVLDLYTDDRFRNRLEINPQTGDLTIKDITPERCGLYRALIYCDKRSTYRRFRVSIIVNTEKGKSVHLETRAQIQKGDQVEWSFRDDPLKRISYNNITLVTGVNGDRNKTKYPNKRFKGRLEMNPETGNLSITDIRQTDEGVYTLKLIKADGKITYSIFNVDVCDYRYTYS